MARTTRRAPPKTSRRAPTRTQAARRAQPTTRRAPTRRPRLTATQELLVQMQINRSNAVAGGSGANVGASALISVLVTQNGAPVDNLGSNAGNGTGATSLPAGWNLFSGFNVRPGGCDITVTEFTNEGSGIYDIRVVPFIDNPACTWLSGEYVYAVETQVIVGRTMLQGGALAKLIIP